MYNSPCALQHIEQKQYSIYNIYIAVTLTSFYFSFWEEKILSAPLPTLLWNRPQLGLCATRATKLSLTGVLRTEGGLFVLLSQIAFLLTLVVVNVAVTIRIIFFLPQIINTNFSILIKSNVDKHSIISAPETRQGISTLEQAQMWTRLPVHEQPKLEHPIKTGTFFSIDTLFAWSFARTSG